MADGEVEWDVEGLRKTNNQGLSVPKELWSLERRTIR
jgi:hypothetical protein